MSFDPFIDRIWEKKPFTRVNKMILSSVYHKFLRRAEQERLPDPVTAVQEAFADVDRRLGLEELISELEGILKIRYEYEKETFEPYFKQQFGALKKEAEGLGIELVEEKELSKLKKASERLAEVERQLKELKYLKERLEAKIAGQKPPAPPPPKKPAWTTELKKKLETIFKATYTRETGQSPSRFLPEFWLELEMISTLNTLEEMQKAAEEFTLEIVRREQARKAKPPRIREEIGLPARPKEFRIGLPPPEEKEGEYIPLMPAEFPAFPEKSFVPSRLLTGSERDAIWRSFSGEIVICGKDPYRYMKEFDEWLGSYLFESWDRVKNNFRDLVDMICKEKKIALKPRALPSEVIDELVHWLVSLRSRTGEPTYHTIEEIQDQLEMMGKPATREDVIASIKRGWEKKVPNFVIVTKQHLEELIGEPLD